MTAQTPATPKQPTDDPKEVFELLRSISSASLDWSWEGTVGMEEQVEAVGAAYGYHNVVSIFSAQSAQLKMGDQETIIKGLKTYLVQAPQVAKYFGIELDASGNPDDEALVHAASERVLITFHLTDS